VCCVCVCVCVAEAEGCVSVRVRFDVRVRRGRRWHGVWWCHGGCVWRGVRVKKVCEEEAATG
jgi:hypothetical protein